MNELLTAKQTAAYLHCSTSRLAKLRVLGRGPRYLKDGRILYPQDELEVYVKERVHSSTSEYETSPGSGRPVASAQS